MDPLSQRLFLWMCHHRDRIHLRIAERRTMRAFFPQLRDLIGTGGVLRPWTGQGCGPTEMEAWLKTVAEILERELMVRHRLPSSNGCAVHTRRKQAARKARLELLERDAFLCHFLTGVPLDPLSGAGLRVHGETLARVRRRLARRGLVLRLYRMRAAARVHAVTATVTMRPGSQFARFGMVMGHGCETDPGEAVAQALVEALRYLAHQLDGGGRKRPLTVEAFLRQNAKAGRSTPSEHAQLLMNPAYRRRLSPLLFDGPAAPPSVGRPFLRLDDVPVSFLRTNWPDLPGLPLSFAKARHPGLLELYFGPTDPSAIDPGRLRRFLGAGPRAKLTLTELPHPFA